MPAQRTCNRINQLLDDDLPALMLIAVFRQRNFFEKSITGSRFDTVAGINCQAIAKGCLYV